MGIGEIASLATAAMWAVASVLYGKTSLNAWTMNLAKNVLASVVLVIHLYLISLWTNRPMLAADATAWSWLSVSGLIGIVLGDTFYFRSLQILGPRRALIVTIAVPAFAVVLGWCFLHESLTVLTVSGMGVTLVGVAWVISERANEAESPGLYPGSVRAGMVFGLLGALCQAVGQVASKLGMDQGSCVPLEASFIRLSVSAGIIGGAMLLSRTLTTAYKDIARRDVVRWLVPACFLGTYLGIWFSQIAVKHTNVAVATTLMSTSPLFAIPLVVIFLRQRVSMRAVAGTLITILGVVLLVK